MYANCQLVYIYRYRAVINNIIIIYSTVKEKICDIPAES